MKNFLIIACLFMLFLTSCFVFLGKKTETNSISYNLNHVERMPLVEDDPFAAMAYGGNPDEQRGREYRKWLATGLKISVKGGSGSGTIIYYDPESGWAYIQSCGHLWSGSMTADEAKRKKPTCEVMTWYHNEQKLNTPKTYNSEVLYYSNERGFDISLLRFKPDWEPNYLPIAPDDFVIHNGSSLHSVGCDGGREIAHYDVTYIGMRTTPNEDSEDLVTTKNSPRPGRSGGGLSTDEFYVGICWGTSAFDGSGNGFFTPLAAIRDYNKKNGYGWLNEVGYSWARMIPIVDRNGPQGKYPKDYVPLPRSR